MTNQATATETSSTWATQFIGAYRLAKATGLDGLKHLRAGVDAKYSYIVSQPGGKEGLEAVATGFRAFEAGMNEEAATAWAVEIEKVSTRRA